MQPYSFPANWEGFSVTLSQDINSSQHQTTLQGLPSWAPDEVHVAYPGPNCAWDALVDPTMDPHTVLSGNPRPN